MAFTARTAGLARAAVAAVGRTIDATVRALTAAWARAWETLAGLFTAALERLLTGVDRWPSRSAIDNDPGLRDALARSVRSLEVLAGQTAAEAGDAAQSAAEQATGEQAEMIASQLPPGQDQEQAAARIRARFSREALLAIVRRIRQRIVSLTRPLSRDAETAMRRQLVRGVRFGRNPRQTAGAMVREVQGAFNGGLSRALVIARTETLDAYRQAAAAVQDANGDTLHGWVWLAKLDDSRTCVACWAMHGTVHPLSEPGPLGHPQCRCSRAPRTKTWRDLGFDLDEPADLIPDAETAFRALPSADQERIMGAARLALLDDGTITWADLTRRRTNPGWRDSIEPVPVKDLAP